MTDPISRQYIKVTFKAGDKREYTYHNDGAAAAVGDRVRVVTREGEKIVTVVGIVDEAPTSFATKGIVGIVTPSEDDDSA